VTSSKSITEAENRRLQLELLANYNVGNKALVILDRSDVNRVYNSNYF